MNPHTAGFSPSWLRRLPATSTRIAVTILLVLAALIPIDAALDIRPAGAVTCAAANITVTPLADPVFYTDFSPSPPSLPTLAGHYTGYRIMNNTGATLATPHVQLSGFSGGVVALAPGQSASQPVGSLAPGASGLAYFYLSASSATTVDQTHTVSVYDRDPSLTGAVQTCATGFTYTDVVATTQAAANKVTIATATSNPPGLGATMTLTVTGETGTVGNGPASDPKGFDMTPAAIVSGPLAWNASAYRLVGVNLNVDLTGGGAANYPDLLHRTFTDASSGNRTYVITYTFRIVGTTTSNTTVSPIQYIASGTQIKHTSTGDSTYQAILPIQPISNTTTLTKTVSPTTMLQPGGTATYTVTATNSGGQSATLDDFTDTPGTGATYVPGSSKFNGVAIADPLASGTNFVWAGAWTVPGGSTRTLTYQMAISTMPMVVTNSVIGHIGSTVIDTTASTLDVSPATSAVDVTAPPKINVKKTVDARVDSSDQFTVSLKNGASTLASATTSGGGTGATTGNTSVTAGTTYTLTDIMAAGSATTISAYEGSISCSNSKSGSPTVLPSGIGTSFTITPVNGDVISCTFTNSPKPKLTLVKSVASRAQATDQFTVSIRNGPSPVASATTSGTGTSVSTGATTVTAGTTYTLTDAMAAGSGSVIGQYLPTIVCTNATGGSATVLPTGGGTSFSITPANNDSITCTITNTPGTTGITIDKTASPASGVSAGNVVTYTYAVTNTGSLSLTNATVTDPMSGLSAIGCTPANGSTLAAGATMTCSATYTVTPADVSAGSILNTGTVNAKDPSNNNVTASGGATVTTAAAPSLLLTKTASPNTGVVAGDLVTYTITGQNTGPVTLHNVTVSDPKPGLSALSCTPTAPATLAPNATITCTATRTVTQADVDAGSITNTATINALDPTNNPVSKTAGATVTPSNTATMSLTKTASPATGVVTGDLVTYTMTGTNTGAVTLHNVTVTDPKPGMSAVSCSPAAPATLAPGATITCTATRTVTQADVDSGSIANTATINALDPTNNPVSKTAGATVTPSNTATLSLTKSASPATGVVAGDLVTYTITGTNTGAVTLHNVGVADPMPGLSAISCTPAAPAVLAPNATITCTATRSVTQPDVDAGSITNTATINALTPTNNPVSKTAGATVTPSKVATLSLAKTASPNTGVVAGDLVTYTITGQNTGAVTLHNVTVTDPMPGLSAVSCTPAAPATLAPNATITCTATRTVTQPDVDAGSITNTATINALDPANNPVTKTAGATVTTAAAPSLSLTKAASPAIGVVAGDLVTYTITGQNTGPVTLHNVTVSDPKPGLSALSCTPTAPATLAPGATITCTATRTVTQADVDAGSITNTATINALDPTNNPVSKTAGATVTPSNTATLSLTKSASPATGVVAGDLVTYTITGTNTGAVTLHNVTVTDPKPGMSAVSCSPAAPAVLAPNATISCTATRTVTQADVDSGSIANTATINGLDPADNTITNTAGATVTPSNTATLSLTKTASPNTGVVTGDLVTYTMTGTNTGAVTLHNVTITDPMPGLSGLSCTPLTPATLASGDALTCTATRTVTQADVDGGSITNTATIDGLDPADNTITTTADATVTPRQQEAVAFTKTASPSSGVVAGTVITYTMTARNTGTVTLTDATIADAKPGLSPLTCTPAQGSDLAPGAEMQCTATYTVTAADVASGSIANTASISGNGTAGPITAAGAATVPTRVGTDVSLAKKLVETGDGEATWRITVTNAGPGELAGPFTVTDDLPNGLEFVSAQGDGWQCTGTDPVACEHAAPLAAGASSSVDLVTKITGPGTLTNTASLDVLGEIVRADAVYRPAGAFAFTGAEVVRVGMLGLFGVIAGSSILIGARRRNTEATNPAT